MGVELNGIRWRGQESRPDFMSLGDSKFERIFPIPEIVIEFGLFTNRASVIGSLGEPGKKADADLPVAHGKAFGPVLPEMTNPNRHAPVGAPCSGPAGGVPTARFSVDAKLAVVNLEQTRGLLAWAFEMVGERAVAGQLPAACQIVDSAHRCRCVIVDERVVESNVGKPTENVQADDIAKITSIIVSM